MRGQGGAGRVDALVDPGTRDVFTFNVDWRDGSTATIPGLGAADATGGAAAASLAADVVAGASEHATPDKAMTSKNRVMNAGI